mmetsp:Transcript_22332/g.52904  ORF Transcript_22332/g.52904 Transcript_22332/m.52904 type:complete len:117 (-) Transcript_22332:67-417(-)
MLLEETDTPKANNKGLIRVKVRLQYAHAHKVSNAPNLPTPTGERPATSAVVGSGITPTSLVPPGPHRKNTPSRVLSPGHLWHEAGRSSSSMSLEKDWNAWNSPRLLAPALPPLKHR